MKRLRIITISATETALNGSCSDSFSVFAFFVVCATLLIGRLDVEVFEILVGLAVTILANSTFHRVGDLSSSCAVERSIVIT